MDIPLLVTADDRQWLILKEAASSIDQTHVSSKK